MSLVTARTQRIAFQPGAVASGTAIALPSGYAIASASHAEIWRYDHSHVAFTLGTTAGSGTAFAEVTPGSGTALSTVPAMGVSALPGSAENASTSTTTGIPAKVAATVSSSTSSTVTLSVDTEAADLLVLDVVSVGDTPDWQ